MTRLTILGVWPTRKELPNPMALTPLMTPMVAMARKAVTALTPLTTATAAATAVLALGLLGACGQRGNLVLPTEPAAQNRATLPQVLLPLPRSSASSPAASTAPSSPPAPAAPTPGTSAAR